VKRFLLSLACAFALLAGLPALAATYYFTDCQSGAHASCAANVGDNARTATQAQSSATPWQTLAAIDTHLGGIDAVPAGTVFVFARGGKWTTFSLPVENLNATAASPIVFDAYTPSWGGSAVPWMVCGSAQCFGFQNFGSTTVDGGYTLRNLKLDGNGVTTRCIGVFDATRNGLIDNVEITGCLVGIESDQKASPDPVKRNQFWKITGSNIHNNLEQGILGSFDYSVIEHNTLTNNAYAETPGFGHNIYTTSSNGFDQIVRYNIFRGSGASSGDACSNGNITGHGQLTGFRFEGNTIISSTVSGGCGSINLNPAYASSSPPEWCRRCIVRGNVIIDAAGDGIAVSGAPGIIIENNTILSTSASTLIYGIVVPGRVSSAGGIYDNAYDDADGTAIVRNNTCYYSTPPSGAKCVRLDGPGPSGTNLTLVGNLCYFAQAAAGTQLCWGDTAFSNYTAWNGNLGFGFDNWSTLYSTHSLAHAAGFDTWSTAGGLADNDPLFGTAPTLANLGVYTLQAGSPALNVAVTGMTRRAIYSDRAVSGRDAGSREKP